MATNIRRNGLSDPSGEGRDKDEFLVFGYACKIFRDDPKALYIDQGKHLIPWMGDENLKIDRYDARGTLHNLQACEAPSGGFHRFDGLTPEERRIEELCDEERYAALYNDELEQEAKREEEIKRLHQELSNDASYRQVAFSYDEDSNPVHGPEPPPIEQEILDEPENPFVPPAALAVPPDLTLPTSQKLALIIARTAQFIVNQGSQMEVIIKFKQAHNPNFGFLSFDHALHPYYKHVMQAIKEGRYTPPKEGEESSQDQEENGEEDEEDEDSDGDHYLHPSLAGGVSSQLNPVSSVLYKLPADSAYLRLAAQLKEKVASLAPPPPPPSHQAGQSVPIPPPTVEAFIDKMACYVAKNGEGFEDIVKAKGDPRFGFLNSSDPFHVYYLQKLEQYGKPHSQAKVSFSIKSKSEAPKTLDKSALQADDDSDEEAQAKDRQEREKAIDDLIEDMVHDQNGKEAEEEEDIAPPGDENGLLPPLSPVLVLTPTRTLPKVESAAADVTVKKDEDEGEVKIVSKEPSLDENKVEKAEEGDNSDIEIVGEAKKSERRSDRRSAERHRKDRDSSRKEKSRSHKHSKKSHKRRRSRSRSRSKSRSRARSVSRSRSYSRSSSRERKRRRRKDEERYRRERERSRERRRRHREQREREERELERQRKKHRRRRSRSHSRSRSRSLSRLPKKSRDSRRYSSSLSRSPSADPDLPSKRAAIEEKWNILRKKAEQKKGEGRIVSGDSPISSPLSQLSSSQIGLDNSSSGSRENSLPPALQQPVVAKLAEGLLAKVRAKVFGGSNPTSPIPPIVSK